MIPDKTMITAVGIGEKQARINPPANKKPPSLSTIPFFAIVTTVLSIRAQTAIQMCIRDSIYEGFGGFTPFTG